MVARAVDTSTSSITLRTRAKGMLSRLAHDLEIRASRFEADLDVDEKTWSATLRVAVRGLRVVGALKGDRVDLGVLKASDRDDIERRIVRDHLATDAIVVTARGDSWQRGEVVIKAPGGEQRLSVPLRVEERSDGELVVTGSVDLSLSKLGVKEIKGPLGAFKVADTVAVAFSMHVAGPASS